MENLSVAHLFKNVSCEMHCFVVIGLNTVLVIVSEVNV